MADDRISYDQDMVSLNGQTLEGGGQLVRNAVALSALTSRPITIRNIRGNRPGKKGLRPSHTSAVKFLADICGAEVIGAQVGSQILTFYPKKKTAAAKEPVDVWRSNTSIQSIFGDDDDAMQAPSINTESLLTEYTIDLPTPGSIFLIFQCIYPYLLYSATSSVRLTIIGGTNVSFSPSYNYFSQVIVPNFAKLGLPELTVELLGRGWVRNLGSARFNISPLRRNGSDDDAALEIFPPINLNEYDRGGITTIDVTVLAADFRIDGKRTSTERDGQQENHDPCMTIRGLIESELIQTLSHEIGQHIPIQICTSEPTSTVTSLHLADCTHVYWFPSWERLSFGRVKDQEKQAPTAGKRRKQERNG